MKKTIHQYIKTFSYLAIIAFVAGTVSGCVGRNAEPLGKVGVSDRAASSSAVSGQAVSTSNRYSRYSYCSDQNLYYIKDCYSEDATLIERNLNDGSERSISVKGIHEVCYADNDWVYYTKRIEVKWEDEDEYHTIVGEVCRSPIDKNSFRMNEKEEELLLKAKDEWGFVISANHVGIDHRGVQCDGRYIVYYGDEYTGADGGQSGQVDRFLRVYDIETGKYVQEELFRTDSFSYSYIDIDDTILYGDSVFLYDDEEEALLRIRLNDGKKMTVAPYDDYKMSEELNSYISTASEGNIFWVNYEGKTKGIWQYNLTEQKSVYLIHDEEIRDLLKQKGLLKCSIGGKEHTFDCVECFFRADRLYVQVEIHGEGSKGEMCENMVVVSKKSGAPDASLAYEEKLNDCLANPEKQQKMFTKKWDGIYGRPPDKKKAYFKSRGLCVSMTEDECLMYIENEDKKKNMPAIYNFHTGSMRFLKKGEDWLSRYIPDRNNRMFSGDPGKFMESYDLCDRMPNNYDYQGE